MIKEKKVHCRFDSVIGLGIICITEVLKLRPVSGRSNDLLWPFVKKSMILTACFYDMNQKTSSEIISVDSNFIFAFMHDYVHWHFSID